MPIVAVLPSDTSGRLAIVVLKAATAAAATPPPAPPRPFSALVPSAARSSRESDARLLTHPSERASERCRMGSSRTSERAREREATFARSLARSPRNRSRAAEKLARDSAEPSRAETRVPLRTVDAADDDDERRQEEAVPPWPLVCLSSPLRLSASKRASERAPLRRA